MGRRIVQIKRFGVWVVLFIGLVGLQGGATAPVPTDYVGHDIQLAPDPEDASLLWWENPEFNWHQYSKLMLDPVSIQFDNKKVEQKFDPEALAALGREFTATVVEKLTPAYPTVNTP